MPSPYRSHTGPGARATSWDPGDILVRPAWGAFAQVLVGDDVGWTGALEPPLPVIGRFVERRALDEKACAGAGLVLPEDLVDPRRFPRVRRAALASELVYVTEAQAKRLQSAGVRVWVVERDVDRDTGGAWLNLGVAGEAFSQFGTDGVLEAASAKVAETLGQEEAEGFRTFAEILVVDHVLSGASEGLLRTHRLELAVALAVAVHPSASSVYQLSDEPVRANPASGSGGREEKLARWENWLFEIEDRVGDQSAQVASDEGGTWLQRAEAEPPFTQAHRAELRKRGVRLVDFPGLDASDVRSGNAIPGASWLIAEDVASWSPPFERIPPRARHRTSAGIFFLALAAAALVLWALGHARERPAAVEERAPTAAHAGGEPDG